MESLLTDELRKYCYVYMDDMTIQTDTFDKYLENLHKLLNILKANCANWKVEILPNTC